MTMKTIQALKIPLTGAMLAVNPLRAEELAKEPAKEPAKEMKCDGPKKEDGTKKPDMAKMKEEMGGKMKAMEAKMKAEAAEAESAAGRNTRACSSS